MSDNRSADTAEQPAPEILASVPPVAALVAAITGEDVTALITGQSPHGWAMRPSDRRLIADADMIVWIGPGLEAGLAKALEGDPRTIELSGQGDGHHSHDHHTDGDHDDSDLHPWLDPHGTERALSVIAAELIRRDPARADHYQSNLQKTLARLEAQDALWQQRLEPLRDQGFLTLHGAWQGFADHFGLRYLGPVSVSPDRPTGAKHLADLRQRARQEGAVCLMGEPQLPRKMATRLADDLDLRQGQLDPLGADTGPDGYFILMDQLVSAMEACLSVRKNDAAASQ